MNNEERKILEFAANACGLWNDTDPWNGMLKATGQYWNPKDNSADCAAMCAKLDINTLFAQTNTIVSCWKEGVDDIPTIHHNANHDGTDAGKEAAWRYAATMVAAKIGGLNGD